MKRLSVCLIILMTALVLASQGLVREQETASAGSGLAIVATIPVGSQPHGVAINPSTNRIYIANQLSGSVSVIDGATDSVVDTIAVGGQPIGVATYPERNRVYVANHFPGVPVIDGATNTVVGTASVRGGGMAANPANDRVYVSALFEDRVSVLSAPTNGEVASVPVGREPRSVAVNAVTNRIYVANDLGSSVSVINGATDSVLTTIGVGGYPLSVAVNPNTNRIYVANHDDDTISVIDGTTNTVVGTPILMPDQPSGIAVNVAANRIYVVNFGDNSLSVIDGATNAILDTVSVGGANPHDVGFNPNTNRIYVGNWGSNTVSVLEDTGGSWQITSSLAEGRVFHSTFVGQGSGGTAYLYATGGQDARDYPPTGPRTTERAAILPDGCLGPWEVVQGADLPDVRRLTNAVKVGQYVYLVGGWNTNVAMASTVRAQVRADGKLEHESDGQPVWETMSSMLNDRRYAHAVVAAQVDGHTYLYAIGGTHESMPMATAHRTIERAEVFANGDLGEWERLATLLPQTSGLTSMAAYVAGGYVYTVGGLFGNSTLTNVVQRAAINSDGTLGPFSELPQAAWPTARQYPAWVVADGVLYLIGGYVGGTYPYVWMDEVDIASLAADGAPEWAVGPSLNVARQYPAAAANGGRIYAVAGRESSPEWGQANLVEVLGASEDCSAPSTYTPTPTNTSTPTRTPSPTPSRPSGVGGIVMLSPAALAEEMRSTAEGSGWCGSTYAALAGGLSAALAVLGVGGWYARRRWLS